MSDTFESRESSAYEKLKEDASLADIWDDALACYLECEAILARIAQQRRLFANG